MKRISILLLFISFSLITYAAAVDSVFSVQHDTLKIKSRSFSEPIITSFKADSAYQYGRPQEGLTPWQRFMIWLATILARLIYYSTQTWIGQILVYTLCAVLILWVILKLLKIEVKDLFYRGGASYRKDFKMASENIHALDFDKLIDEAVAKERYREAVRLVFLSSLKKLSEAQLIQWLPGKTNDEYLLELKQHPAVPRVQELRYYFDYAWYGHFEINNLTYYRVNETFQDFKKKIG